MKKPRRNAPCPCGSGLKYKRCCETKDLLASLEEEIGPVEPDEEAEMYLHGQVYDSILMSVWIAFHGTTANMPDMTELEDFYRDVYGYDLDIGLVDEIVLPLPADALARLRSVIDQSKDTVIDLEQEPETAPQAEPVPPPSKPDDFPASPQP